MAKIKPDGLECGFPHGSTFKLIDILYATTVANSVVAVLEFHSESGFGIWTNILNWFFDIW